MKRFVLALGFAAALFSTAALADDISDALNAAAQAYTAGNLSEAKRQADYASTLIAQKNAEALKQFLPAPLDGWTAEDADTSSMPTAMFGGGMTAQRKYKKDGKSVEVSIIADSPMMASIGAMLQNPQMVAMSGGKMVKVGSQMAMMTQGGEIQFLVANRFYVTVSGSADEADKLAYANAIDLAGLAAFQ